MSRFEQEQPTTQADAGALAPTLSVEEAASLLGIGRTLAYQLAKRDKLPVPVVRIGRSLRVPTAPLLALLGLDGTGEPQTARVADRAATGRDRNTE